MTVANIVLDAAMNARAANLEQDRLLAEAETLVATMARTPLTLEQRALVAAASRALREFRELNECEGEQHQIIAGLADQLAPELEKWSQNKVIRCTRDPLATLVNPIIQGQPRRNAECRVMYVIQAAPPELIGSRDRPNLTVRNQLGRAKTQCLWDLVAEQSREAAAELAA